MTSPAAAFPPSAAPAAAPRRAALPQDAFDAGLAFHRLVFARRRSGWWTPLVVGVLGVALYAAMLAVAAGWLTWRTGGLEAGIALHIVNNLVAFLLGLAGLSDINATDPGVMGFVSSAVLIGAYVGLVEVAFRRSPHHRTLRLTPEIAANR